MNDYLDIIDQITELKRDIAFLKGQMASLESLIVTDKDKIICKWCSGLGRLGGDDNHAWYICQDCEGHGYHVVSS